MGTDEKACAVEPIGSMDCVCVTKSHRRGDSSAASGSGCHLDRRKEENPRRHKIALPRLPNLNTLVFRLDKPSSLHPPTTTLKLD